MKPLILIVCAALMAGCAITDVPQLVIHYYKPQIQPTEPPIQEIRANDPFYSTASDPSLVTFKSVTDRKLFVSIDRCYDFYLLPDESKCFAFPVMPGREDIIRHTVEVRVERLTQYYGSWDTVRKFDFFIRLDGQPQMFYLSDR